MLENIPLKDLTTMKVGGKARFFVSVKDEAELINAVDFARAQCLSIFVLGGGSNVVISDDGFSGLVIKNEIQGIGFSDTQERVVAKAGAGENWDKFVEMSVERGLCGLENLSFIPGTVGAAPVQNIGAYGVELKDTPLRVRAFDLRTGEFCIFNNSECEFSYRDSIFKKNRELIITEVEFVLHKEKELNLSYKDLRAEVEKRGGEANLSTKDVREMVIDIRKRKLPDPQMIPTAGSFFKNPVISKERFETLKSKFPDMPGFDLGNDQVKVPLAWIIENVAKLKGVELGGAAVCEKHALVLVNKNDARATDVYDLATRVQEAVFDLTGIEIETEVQFIGEF